MKYKCAGVVLYNPDINRLIENYKTISKQVDDIIFVDNNSDNFKEINDEFHGVPNVRIIKNKENKGIATALNQICQEAKNLKYEWVYLLDQDSISSTSIISSYSKNLSNERVALLSPYIIDTNKTSIEEYQQLRITGVTEVDWAITAGSMIRLDVWELVGKFDEELFIDAVDIDYSIRLKVNGFQQLRVNYDYILQEVGKAEPTFIIRPHRDNAGKWTLKRYYRSNHSDLRQYYMVRNNIILTKRYRKYKSSCKGYLFIALVTLPKLIFEKNKMKLVKAILKGMYDGANFKVKEYESISKF